MIAEGLGRRVLAHLLNLQQRFDQVVNVTQSTLRWIRQENDCRVGHCLILRLQAGSREALRS
jgi:hypothetical protein